jgi:hypothetical protein
MGGGNFLPLKAGPAAPESGGQAESRLASLAKILAMARRVDAAIWPQSGKSDIDRLCLRQIPRDMANWPESADFVIQFTVLAGKLTQYSARKCS